MARTSHGNGELFGDDWMRDDPAPPPSLVAPAASSCVLVPQVVPEAGVAKGTSLTGTHSTLSYDGLPYIFDGPEWLIAIPPLARKLGIKDVAMLVRRIPKDWVRKATIQTNGGPQLVWCATWDGFGVIVQRSDKEEAYGLQNRMAALLGKEIRQKLGLQPAAVIPFSQGIDVSHLVAALVPALTAAVVAATRPDVVLDTNDRVQRIEGTVDQTFAAVKDMRDRLPIQRRDLESDTIEKHRQACRQFTNGMCPRCRLTRIVGDDGRWLSGSYEFDHWYRRDKNRVEQTWPLCKACHKLVSDDVSIRDEWAHNWFVYQEHVEMIEQPLLRGAV